MITQLAGNSESLLSKHQKNSKISFFLFHSLQARVGKRSIFICITLDYYTSKNEELKDAQLNIGFDIDGVISDFATTLAEVIRDRYNLQLTEKDIFCHDLDFLLGVSKEDGSQIVKETLLRDLEIVTGAKEAMLKLNSEGHKIFILTARHRELESLTRDWLERKGIPYSELLMLKEGEKYLADVQLDLIVEDNLEDAIGWSKKVKNVIVIDRPWNKSFNVKNLFKRVYSWKGVLDEIETIKCPRAEL